MAVVVANPHTDAWYEARKTAIGASEIAAAAGLSVYQTPLEIYLRKRGELPPLEETDAMRLGKALEPVVKQEFVHHTGIQLRVEEPPMFRHPKHAEIVATPDGIISPREDLQLAPGTDLVIPHGEMELLETKTASWRMKGYWGGELTDAVPDQYLCQAQIQMEVCGASLCHVAVLFDGCTFKRFMVQRNDELIDLLVKAGLRLMSRVKDARPPDPDWMHSTTAGLISKICKTTTDAKIMLSDEGQHRFFEAESLAKDIKDRQARRETLIAQVNYEIGGYYAGVLSDGRMVKRIDVAPSQIPAYERAGYSYLRAVKADSGRIVEREEQPAIQVDEDKRLSAVELSPQVKLLCQGNDRGTNENGGTSAAESGTAAAGTSESVTGE